MKNNTSGFIIFFLILFLICFLISNINSNKNKENYEDLFVESLDIARTKPDSPTVKITTDEDPRGWKDYYRKKFLKGKVKYPDNFEGTQIRNYLDNMCYLKN
tara:strand:+ start:239 stop:544 length:306 start_codon:yes stop_codon:yes gene_type:complete